MPTEWSEGILLSELADEPELSEELSAIFARLKEATPEHGDGGGLDAGGSGGAGGTGAGAGTGVPWQPPSVVLNFAGVSYLNSSHIAALLRMRKLLGEAGRKLVLCSMTSEVWTMVRLTGLDKVFVFAPDTMTGLAMVQLGAEGKG